MKRIIKKISFLILIVIALVFTCPSNTYAITKKTSYVSINNTENLEVESLSFTNISFKNYSHTSSQSFGLTGSVRNNSTNKINYISTVHYFDTNHNLIAQGYNTWTAMPGDNDFNQMSNLSVMNGHSIDEICYYTLSINTTDYISSLGPNAVLNNTPSKNSEYSSYDYVIDKYDINIKVNENNTLDIKETIVAYFNISKHGIFRTIPLKNKIIRLDGTTSINRTQITNVSVNNEYTASKENGNYKLQIGSASHTLTGEQTYVIRYTYNLGKDAPKDYDELYYNIIGNEWDTVIGNISFTITMPKDFDSSKLGFSSGATGATDSSKITYTVNENKITGSYNGILAVGEALTVRCELPEGYFVGASNNLDSMLIFSAILPILFLLVAYLIWRKYGKDEPVIETVEFYPPAGFNSLEVGFLYKGNAGNEDVTSLLVYLANKGYIKISEFEGNSLFSKSQEFKITKLREYDGNNINEQLFLNGLFSKKTATSSLDSKNLSNNNYNEVTSIDLYNSFYITMNTILSNINNKENKDTIFEKKASSKAAIIVLMIIGVYCLITIPPIYAYGDPSTIALALFFPGVGFTVMVTMTLRANKSNPNRPPVLFGIVWGMLFGGIPWIAIVLPTLLSDYIYMVVYIIGLLCIIGLIIILKYLPKRTPYGNQILGKLKGFKNFLETVEKDKLEAMVMQDPSYFYNILPYTYVLGVSDKWIEKFETISLQAPSWYYSSRDFNIAKFETFMNDTMSSAKQSMSSRPSSGRGGSSGGGSSGGGSGGGGGGSW